MTKYLLNKWGNDMVGARIGLLERCIGKKGEKDKRPKGPPPTYWGLFVVYLIFFCFWGKP